jgi:hypothetical protein
MNLQKAAPFSKENQPKKKRQPIDRPQSRLKYQYELAEILLGMSRRQIRSAMYYKDMGNTTEEIADFIMYHFLPFKDD